MGSGHLMRCLTLAEDLKAIGFSISFISKEHEGNLNSLIIDKGYNLKVLKNL